MQQNYIRNKELFSHELLSEVLGFKAWQVTGKSIDWLLNARDNDIVYERKNDNQYLIDADYFIRLCKEWLIDNDCYRVHSGITYDSDIDSTYDVKSKSYGYCVIFNKQAFKDFQPYKTELEAVIAACEYKLSIKKD